MAKVKLVPELTYVPSTSQLLASWENSTDGPYQQDKIGWMQNACFQACDIGCIPDRMHQCIVLNFHSEDRERRIAKYDCAFLEFHLINPIHSEWKTDEVPSVTVEWSSNLTSCDIEYFTYNLIIGHVIEKDDISYEITKCLQTGHRYNFDSVEDGGVICRSEFLLEEKKNPSELIAVHPVSRSEDDVPASSDEAMKLIHDNMKIEQSGGNLMTMQLDPSVVVMMDEWTDYVRSIADTFIECGATSYLALHPMKVNSVSRSIKFPTAYVYFDHEQSARVVFPIGYLESIDDNMLEVLKGKTFTIDGQTYVIEKTHQFLTAGHEFDDASRVIQCKIRNKRIVDAKAPTTEIGVHSVKIRDWQIEVEWDHTFFDYDALFEHSKTYFGKTLELTDSPGKWVFLSNMKPTFTLPSKTFFNGAYVIPGVKMLFLDSQKIPKMESIPQYININNEQLELTSCEGDDYRYFFNTEKVTPAEMVANIQGDTIVVYWNDGSKQSYSDNMTRAIDMIGQNVLVTDDHPGYKLTQLVDVERTGRATYHYKGHGYYPTFIEGATDGSVFATWNSEMDEETQRRSAQAFVGQIAKTTDDGQAVKFLELKAHCRQYADDPHKGFAYLAIHDFKKAGLDKLVARCPKDAKYEDLCSVLCDTINIKGEAYVPTEVDSTEFVDIYGIVSYKCKKMGKG